MSLDFGLEDKNIIVTGGNGGIGQLLVNFLIAQGANVTVIARDINSHIPTLCCDLTDDESIEQLCQLLTQKPVEILVNLAGLMYFGHFTEQKTQQLQDMLSVNLMAPMRLTQAVLPQMLKRGSGQIVNVGSVFGSLAFPHFVTYLTTKAGLKGFSEALRREYTGKGISVTHISPRAVKTAMNGGLIETLHQQTKTHADRAEHVASVIGDAILHKRKNVSIGQPESFFMKLNAVLPGVVDNALVSKRDIAEAILAAH